MNPLTKLLREQKEEYPQLFKYFSSETPYDEIVPEGVPETGVIPKILNHEMNNRAHFKMSQVLNWHTTAQQQLIDVIISEIKRTKEPISLDYEESRDTWFHGHADGFNQALQTQINLLEEAKKNV